MKDKKLVRNPMNDLALTSLIYAFAVVFFIYMVFAGGTTHGRSPNEQSRIELAVALAKFGSVSLDPVISTYGTPFDRSEIDGSVYSDKAPGLSLLAVPIVWLVDQLSPRELTSLLPSYTLLRHLLTWILVTLPAALFPFLALGVYSSGHSQLKKNRIALLFALATPLMTYSGVLFGHVPSGILAAVAWKLTLIPEAEDKRITSPVSAALAGLLLAVAVTIEYPTAIVGFVIFPTMVLRRVPFSTLAAFAVFCVIGLVPCLIYHQLAFGSPFTTGYAFKSDWWHALVHRAGFFGVTIPRLEHFWGVLAGMKRGILFFCPILLLIPFGFIKMEREKRTSSYSYIALGIVYLLFAAGFSDWQAGWSAAARHLVPCILIFIFPFAKAVEFITQEDKNQALRLALLYSVGFSLTGSLLSLSLTPFFPEHFSSPLGQLVLPAMADGFFAPTLLSGDGLASRGYAIGLVSLISFGAVTWVLLGLMSPLKIKVVVPISLILASALYAGVIWCTAQPLANDQLQMRREVLRHIGYDSQQEVSP